jgi:hypothetical protein
LQSSIENRLSDFQNHTAAAKNALEIHGNAGQPIAPSDRFGSFRLRRILTWRQFLYGVLLLVTLFMMSGTTGDPDLWGHVRFGQDMLAQGAVTLPDTYSFTSDRPWINHEWLSEVAMALAFEYLGAAGLNGLRIAVICCVLALVWYASAHVSPRHQILIVSVGAVGIYLRAHPIRPQLFSLVMFALLLTVLARSDERKSLRPLTLVPILMALWVNFHGGWIVGFGVLGLWCLVTAVTASWRERFALAAVLVASLAATLLNPYYVGMWEFLATTVRLERPMIADWQPLFALSPLLWVSWCAAFAIVAVTATRARLALNSKSFVIAAFLGLMALRVSRLDAFFAIAGMFFAASALRNGTEAAPAAATCPRRSLAPACAFALCVVATVLATMPRVLAVPMAPGAMPDLPVVRYVQDQRLKGNVLTWFDWGQYAIWHFGPDLKVSMDGRRETVYSDGLVAAHMDFYFGKADAWRYADTLQPDYVWIPKELPVTGELRRHGWYPLCEGQSSILLTRRPVTPQCPQRATESVRTFPQL